MADMTNVDADKLRQTAQKIGSLAGDLSGNVAKINDAMTNLSKSWKSDAATKFMQTWQIDREALNEMVVQYREVSELMTEMAQEFDKSEEEVSSMIAKLKLK